MTDLFITNEWTHMNDCYPKVIHKGILFRSLFSYHKAKYIGHAEAEVPFRNFLLMQYGLYSIWK